MRNALLIGLLLIPVSSLVGQISSYPYMEDFESYSTCNASCPAVCVLGNGWVNDGDDDTDWVVFTGSTPTAFTGPDQDF